MQKTDNYQLNQWIKSDRIQMEDFNADNLKTDTALKANADAIAAAQTAIAKCGNCKLVTGSYTGTGAHDTGSTLTLNFEGTPVLVIIHTKTYKIHGNDTMLLVRGAEWAFSSDDDHTNYRCSVSWGSKSVSWTPQDNAYAGMNGENTAYCWVALVAAE